MRPLNLLACCAVIATVSSIALRSQSPNPANAVLFEGARLIVGDGSAPIEGGAFVVRNGHITAVGRKGTVSAPAGAVRVDLTGKTVIPAMVNVHVHIRYEGYSSWGAQNHTPKNVLDHLQREAFYGVGATQSVGSSREISRSSFSRTRTPGNFRRRPGFFPCQAWRRPMAVRTRS